MELVNWMMITIVSSVVRIRYGIEKGFGWSQGASRYGEMKERRDHSTLDTGEGKNNNVSGFCR